MKLKLRITLIAVIPLILMGVISYYVAKTQITEKMSEEVYTGLQSTALSVRNALELEIPGEYHVDENGQFWKGDALNISEATDIADSIKENAGIEVTVFFGDTRYMTSVLNDEGGQACNRNTGNREGSCRGIDSGQ